MNDKLAASQNSNFHIFPSENFIDLCLYQDGHEKCSSGHLFGPATRNHYLFHYVLSGTGTLMAANSKGENQTYKIHSGQGFMIFPEQITTYIADVQVPWEYVWVEFDGLRTTEILNICGFSKDAPVYTAGSAELRKKLAEELLYISSHSDQSPFHLMGHLYLFFDLLLQSAPSHRPAASSKMSDYYIKESINFIEQNFQNSITIEDIAAQCGINRSYLGRIFHSSTGRSPQEFLIRYRMTKAAELLKLTSLSIGDIGSAVGYENALHFSRAFKNVYGVAPREWRMQHK